MYSETTTELLLKSVTASAFKFLIVIFAPGLTYACCTDREQPISNCSFTYDYNQETVLSLCEIRGSAEHLMIDTCPDGGFTDVTNIPGTVKSMAEYYYTTCSPTIQPSIPLAASSCHTHCNHGNTTVYLGLNITFKAEEWSSEDLEAISISLRRGTDTTLRCIQFYLGRNQLSRNAAASHYFYFDGFVGLQPGVEYTVNVMALPTNLDWSNVQTKISIPAPYETCWRPELLDHDTPFAVNITLFQDVFYNFKRFDVSLGRQTKEIDFNTAELYRIDGKWGTNVIFECQQPTTQERYLIIEPKECPYCVSNMTRIHIKAAPPSFLDCPRDGIIHKVKQGRFVEGDIVRGINWTVPTPIFQSKCQHGSNTTHIPMESQFVVGRTTSVTYYVSQYGSVAECTFNVHVKLEKSVSLPLIIGVSCAVSFLLILIIIMAFIYFVVYTKRSTGNEISDGQESVPKKDQSDVLRSISSIEEHGIPLYLLRDYPESQLSLNSTKINSSQALNNPHISQQMKLQSSCKCCRPTMEHSSSGYMSDINRNSSHPRHIGEENSTLLCNVHQCDNMSEECYTDDLQECNDEPPMSMQYIH